MSAPRETAPNNAVLANVVDEKDLKSEKKHLSHVAIDQAQLTSSGGLHLVKPTFEEKSQHHLTAVTGATSSGGNHVETASSGEVSVQSSISMDTTQEMKPQVAAQIQSLLSRLSTTTSQVDEYSRRANERISQEANRRVQQIIGETQQAQDALLRDASSRAMEIEAEYSAKLKAFLQELDASKASNLASLEKDLNFRQEALLSGARDEIDRINSDATAQKIGVMKTANANLLNDVDRLTDQVKVLGEAEVERRMNSTTTTVIKTQVTTDSKSEAHLGTEKLTAAERSIISKEEHSHVQGVHQVTEPRAANITRI